MFNKGHYTFLAKTMYDCKPDDGSMFDMAIWRKVVYTLAHDLSIDNPHFDRSRFYKKCGSPRGYHVTSE